MEEQQQEASQRAGRRRTPQKPQIEVVADPRRSRSLEYGAVILRCYSGERSALGIAELAAIVDISRSTVHRYATTLVELGYLEQDSKRKYRLAPRASDPGRVAIEGVRAEAGARAVLEELRDELGHTVSMGVLCGGQVLYVYRLFAHRRGQFAVDRTLESGAGVPVYCTALGKVLLASLPAIEREQLLAELELEPQGPNAILDRRELLAAVEQIGTGEAVLSDEEQLAGARSVAVLVPGKRGGGHTLAIDVTAPAAACSASRLLSRARGPLKRAANAIGDR
jgi:DNA-binding IclR family transcriptional regulator